MATLTPIMDGKHLSEAARACLIESNCGVCPLNKAGVNYPGCQTQLGKAITDYIDEQEKLAKKHQWPYCESRFCIPDGTTLCFANGDADALTFPEESSECDGDNLVISEENIFLLSAKQCKMILYITSKIGLYDSGDETYYLYAREFCETCKEIFPSGENYKDAKGAIEKLAKMGWISIKSQQGKTTSTAVKIHEDLFPFLQRIARHYTKDELRSAMQMKSKYGIRLWAALKNTCGIEEKRSFDLAELKRKLGGESYKRAPDFCRFVLDIAINDINEHSGMRIKYSRNKNPWGRNIESITFNIKQKTKVL